MHLKISKFDISSIPSNSIVVLISRRNGGKTTCLKDIMYYQKDIPIGIVINPTESSNEAYGSMVPSLFIHEEFSGKLLSNLLDRQKVIIKRQKRDVRAYGKSNIDPRSFLILDDCMYDGIWKKDKGMRFVFMNGRHQQLLCVITLQYVMGIPPDLRCNVDFTFIFNENNIKNRKKLYENYASIIPTFEMFCSILDSVTENYGCLVIKNMERSRKLEDCIFWYEAETHPDFNIGSREFWKKHNECVNDDDVNNDDENYDPSAFSLKPNKNMPQLNIKKIYR